MICGQVLEEVEAQTLASKPMPFGPELHEVVQWTPLSRQYFDEL
jgi:hypothetical protein